MSAAVREEWTAEELAGAFDRELAGRQVACGVLGIESLPVGLTTGFWARAED